MASLSAEGQLNSTNGLRRNSLSYVEVLAQSVSVIAPSTVPAVLLGLIFASAGNGTWLSFFFGMVGMVLVSCNINQFARRSAAPGSLYSYIVRGLGPTAGVLGGWALLFGYILTGMSTLCGFAVVADVLSDKIGIHVPPLICFAAGVMLAFYVAFRDIQLSAKMMLVCEGAALLAVVILGVLIWQDKGFAIDAAQVTLTGVTPGGVTSGVVLVVFAFSGFESATSLGGEAKDPLRTIPRSVSRSVIVTGLVFTFMAYVVVLGFKDAPIALDKAEAPLDYLAKSIGWGRLSTFINLGILLSFFSCTLASINSTARIVFSMARHGLFADALGEAHITNKTPYLAVALSALVTFLVPAAVSLFGVSAFEAQGYFGTLCSFGFLLVYVLISIAAPIYLREIGVSSKMSWIYSGLALVFLALPFIGTVGIPGSSLFPPAEFPNNMLAGLFILYMALALGWLTWQRMRHPRMIPAMRKAIEKVELQFSDIEGARPGLTIPEAVSSGH